MMSIQEILHKVSSISNDNQEYIVFEDDTNKCYFGKDKTGHIAFLIESSSPNISPLCQETKSLSFVFNKRCKLVCNGECKRKVIIICKPIRPRIIGRVDINALNAMRIGLKQMFQAIKVIPADIDIFTILVFWL